MQKPVKKARQQNEAKVKQWREETILELKKATSENRIIVYVDESGFYFLPLVSRTWAPKGQTPVIAEKAGKEHLSGPPQRFNCGDDAQWQAIHQRAGQGI